MAFLLETYGGPKARVNLLARYSELNSVIDVTGALVREQAAGQLDLLAYRKSAHICETFRRVVGAIGDTDGQKLPVEEHIALCRIKRAVRDAALTFPWPYTPAGSGNTTITVNARAESALNRLLAYEHLRDFDEISGPRYNGIAGNVSGLLADAQQVCLGVSLSRS
jgi:hypothetical protein